MDRRDFFYPAVLRSNAKHVLPSGSDPRTSILARFKPRTKNTWESLATQLCQKFSSECKRAAASYNLLRSFNHLSVIKINPNNWVRWCWIASNNNNTVVMQIAPFGRMARFVTEAKISSVWLTFAFYQNWNATVKILFINFISGLEIDFPDVLKPPKFKIGL